MKTIKNSVVNTFNRVGIPFESLMAHDNEVVTVSNRFGGGSCETTPLVKYLIGWVYNVSNAYENGDMTIKVSDFDRVRMFVLEEDNEAYYTCLD